MNANDDGYGIVGGDLKPRSRRLPSNLEAARVSGPDGEYKSLTQIVVSKLRQSIFDGSIFDGEYGPGSRLNITDLAKRLDVSPIPVREALRLLEAEQQVLALAGLAQLVIGPADSGRQRHQEHHTADEQGAAVVLHRGREDLRGRGRAAR